MKNELDVDFIGGQSPLTNAEEKALSDFFKQHKSKPAASLTKQRQVKRTKPIAVKS